MANGFVPMGVESQTLANQLVFSKFFGSRRAMTPANRKRRKTTAKKKRVTRRAAARKRPAKRPAKTGGRLKKGSPAAKRHMAKLRKMQGR